MAMGFTVPPEITQELTQILSNLVLGDNEIRQNAEETVNDRLEHSPELYILALAHFAISADTEMMRSFSFVLLRRLLFRPFLHHQSIPHRLTLYDRLSAESISALERQLLHALPNESSKSVRTKSVDTICDLANQSMSRGMPWHVFQTQAFAMSRSSNPELRDIGFRILAGCPNLVTDLQTDSVLEVLQRGLQDTSVEVRHAALTASVSYLNGSDTFQHPQTRLLLYPMLDALSRLSAQQLPAFFDTLIPLCTSHPSLFSPHLSALLSFLSGLVLQTVDPGLTPTVARPFPNTLPVFSFPPLLSVVSSVSAEKVKSDEAQEKETLRRVALELMVSLSEAGPSMVKKQDGWVNVIVRGCLEGMGEFPDDITAQQAWLDADPSDDATDDLYPHIYEQSLDRIACALGGKSVLPPAFSYIPSMLASYDWRLRHAGLMAITSIGEGTAKVMRNELGKVVDLLLPLFDDSNPRVRYAACQCVGQLCTDFEEVIREQYHPQLFSALIATLAAPEPRVHSHAAAALVNFCEGVERLTLLPYLDAIVARLLELLNPVGAGYGVKKARSYVQEQAITTLAMVADASESSFVRHYSKVMPLLLNIISESAAADCRKLRVKAMECAGLIAIAVGRDVFRSDASTLIELLMRIQNCPMDPTDALLPHCLISTWAKVCQALGSEFEQFLPIVMPPLFAAAGAKADVSVYYDDEKLEDREGWETISLDGQIVGVRTSAIEEKCQAFETLLVYSTTLGPRFAPYLAQSLEMTLSSLRFYFHDGVREACATLVPALLACGKSSGTLTEQMVSATFMQLINCIETETDTSFLSSLFRCFTNILRLEVGPLAPSLEFEDGIIEATKRQIQRLGEQRKRRVQRPLADLEDEREELELLEEMEEYALHDMSQMLQHLNRSHSLLIAISSIRDLGLDRWGSEDESESE